jgi:hypothetical protein
MTVHSSASERFVDIIAAGTCAVKRPVSTALL